MQVFKTALRIVINHPIHLLVYIGFLSCMGVFMAASIPSGEDTGYQAPQTPFAVIDRDNSELSQGLRAFLGQNGQAVAMDDDPFALQDALATGHARYLLIIPAGYSDDFLKAARASGNIPPLQSAYSFETMVGRLVDEQVNQYLGLASATARLEPDASMSAVVQRANKAVATTVEVETISSPNARTPSDQFAFYLKGCAYTITVSIVVSVGLLMSIFNRTDVQRRNVIAPLSSLHLGLQKTGACVLVMVTVWAITCGIGFATFGSTLANVPAPAVGLAVLSAFVFALVPLSIGVLLGQLGASDIMANVIGNIGGMVMAFLGGVWVSPEFMGPEIQALARFIPTSWYTDAVSKSIHLSDVSLEGAAPILGNLGIIALFAIALFALALAAGRLRMRTAQAGGNAGAAPQAS